MRQKIFEGNLDTSPSLLSINFFGTRKLLKLSTEGFLYDMFWYCEKKIFEGNLDTSPSLLFINFFATRIFLKHSTERFLYEMFRYSETKNSTKNRDITLLIIKFFDTRISDTLKSSPTNFFGTVRQEIFDGKS